jgi:hypothetical protein
MDLNLTRQRKTNKEKKSLEGLGTSRDLFGLASPFAFSLPGREIISVFLVREEPMRGFEW